MFKKLIVFVLIPCVLTYFSVHALAGKKKKPVTTNSIIMPNSCTPSVTWDWCGYDNTIQSVYADGTLNCSNVAGNFACQFCIIWGLGQWNPIDQQYEIVFQTCQYIPLSCGSQYDFRFEVLLYRDYTPPPGKYAFVCTMYNGNCNSFSNMISTASCTFTINGDE
jgi:hypothetical protein